MDKKISKRIGALWPISIGSVIIFSLIAGRWSMQPSMPAVEHRSGADFPVGDGDAILERSMARAQIRKTRVLVIFGGDWCQWCRLIQNEMSSDHRLSELIQHKYELVQLDSQASVSLESRFGAKVDSVPFISITTATGEVLINQKTEPFEQGDDYNVDRLYQFLDRWSK